jgi:hypothetical protein
MPKYSRYLQEPTPHLRASLCLLSCSSSHLECRATWRACHKHVLPFAPGCFLRASTGDQEDSASYARPTSRTSTGNFTFPKTQHLYPTLKRGEWTLGKQTTIAGIRRQPPTIAPRRGTTLASQGRRACPRFPSAQRSAGGSSQILDRDTYEHHNR